MSGAKWGLAYPSVLAGLLAIIAIACAPAAAVPSTAATPEKASLKIGLPVHGASNLAIYLAAERTAAGEGLNVEVLDFGGSAGMFQALASDSIDVAVPSLDGLLDLLNAEQQVKGFYAGVSQSGFEWFARPELTSWADLKGRSVGISSPGSLVSRLTRHAVRKHGLEPERDILMVQVGGSPTAFQALKAGRIDAALLTAPFKWQAAAEGFTRLGTQATEIAEEFPTNIYTAKERFLDERPNTVRALLRAYVNAIRLAKADREAATQALTRTLKLEQQYAERAAEEVVAKLSERGSLPTESMPVFWEIVIATGDVTEPWPESRYFDRRFVDSFDAWAPK